MLNRSSSNKHRQRVKTAGSRGYLDFELKNYDDLRAVGSYKWLTPETAEPLCAAWAVDNGPGQMWLRGDPPPTELFDAEIIVAHNAPFECLAVQHVMHPRHGWPLIPITRFSCTMARCLAVGYPAGLGKAADAYSLKNRKDIGGQRLMHSMNKPRRARTGEDPAAGPYWHEDPERLARLCGYAGQDREVLRELDGVVPELTEFERRVWLLDYKINYEHGFRIDRKLTTNAYKIAQQAGPEIDAKIAEMTGGIVTGINQTGRLLKWAQSQGYTGKSLSRDAIERWLAQEALP